MQIDAFDLAERYSWIGPPHYLTDIFLHALLEAIHLDRAELGLRHALKSTNICIHLYQAKLIERVVYFLGKFMLSCSCLTSLVYQLGLFCLLHFRFNM